MRVWIAAALVLAQVSTAFAQATPPTAETPPAEETAQAPAPCGDLPTAPAAINVATVSTAQVSAASERQAQWRRQASEVIECRRLYYNARIARFNEVNRAWSAELDAFCARRDIRCTDRQRQEAQPPAE